MCPALCHLSATVLPLICHLSANFLPLICQRSPGFVAIVAGSMLLQQRVSRELALLDQARRYMRYVRYMRYMRYMLDRARRCHAIPWHHGHRTNRKSDPRCRPRDVDDRVTPAATRRAACFPFQLTRPSPSHRSRSTARTASARWRAALSSRRARRRARPAPCSSSTRVAHRMYHVECLRAEPCSIGETRARSPPTPAWGARGAYAGGQLAD